MSLRVNAHAPFVLQQHSMLKHKEQEMSLVSFDLVQLHEA